ncbi:hypothetical protein [Enterococcus cecorum]|uniref:hypothetical protein n=1 Tax=Enterococcus cecorum TaxID=44008 RepID=UPI00148D9771|nr:hypothetical protein [Enterococcus cecorum]
MELINVLNLMAEGKIKEGTKLEFDGFEYEFSEDHFEDDSGNWLEDVHEISASFLNLEVELIPPKEKKYLVKINIHGLQDRFTYLNYCGTNGRVNLHDRYRLSSSIQTEFTKQELQSIQPVREFLEDMQGKVEDDEIY